MSDCSEKKTKKLINLLFDRALGELFQKKQKKCDIVCKKNVL